MNSSYLIIKVNVLAGTKSHSMCLMMLQRWRPSAEQTKPSLMPRFSFDEALWMEFHCWVQKAQTGQESANGLNLSCTAKEWNSLHLLLASRTMTQLKTTGSHVLTKGGGRKKKKFGAGCPEVGWLPKWSWFGLVWFWFDWVLSFHSSKMKWSSSCTSWSQ